MKRPFLHTAAACTVLLAALGACQQRAESPEQSTTDPASAEDSASVGGDAALAPDGQFGIAGAVGNGTVEERAQARYDTTIAQAQRERDTARQGCEALTGDPRSACMRNADSVFDAARSTAQTALEAERKGTGQVRPQPGL